MNNVGKPLWFYQLLFVPVYISPGSRSVFYSCRFKTLITLNAGFKHMIKVIEPRYQLPSRPHFSQKIIPGLYEKIKWFVFKETVWALFMLFNLSNNLKLFSVATVQFCTSDGYFLWEKVWANVIFILFFKISTFQNIVFIFLSKILALYRLMFLLLKAQKCVINN